jgi:hypothetical protein
LELHAWRVGQVPQVLEDLNLHLLKVLRNACIEANYNAMRSCRAGERTHRSACMLRPCARWRSFFMYLSLHLLNVLQTRMLSLLPSKKGQQSHTHVFSCCCPRPLCVPQH